MTTEPVTPPTIAMHCASCGAAARLSAKFCVVCGAPLAQRICAQCQAVNASTALYCAECGTPMDVEARMATALVVPASGMATSAAADADDDLGPEVDEPRNLREWIQQGFGVPGTYAFRIVNLIVMVLVYLSIGAIMLESIPELQEWFDPYFQVFELVVTLLFTVEYACNIYVAKNKRAYIFSIWGIIDFLAIFPTLLHFADLLFLRIVRTVRLLRLLRLLRILRVLKILKAMRTLREAAGAAEGSTFKEDLQLYFACLFSVVVISATLVYYAEAHVEGTPFTHIPAAMWWTLLTISSIGYENFVPVTALGRAVAVVTLFAGLGLFALLVTVVGRGLREYNAAKGFTPQA
ncbi:MAG: ion transporter [Chloroflexi bacterium]|nr:ion transporter [Chloroflexota bacterium]